MTGHRDNDKTGTTINPATRQPAARNPDRRRTTNNKKRRAALAWDAALLDKPALDTLGSAGFRFRRGQNSRSAVASRRAKTSPAASCIRPRVSGSGCPPPPEIAAGRPNSLRHFRRRELCLHEKRGQAPTARFCARAPTTRRSSAQGQGLDPHGRAQLWQPGWVRRLGQPNCLAAAAWLGAPAVAAWRGMPSALAWRSTR